MKRGGGLAVIANKNVDVKLILESEKQTFQIAKWKIAIPSLVITLVGVYKPPNTSNFDFHDDFLDWISDTIALDKNIIIMGDFNHYINKQLDEDSSNFMESMLSVGLMQHVEFGTHESDNILDLVFTESSSDFSVVKCRSGLFVSDHCIVICDMALAKPEIKCRQITYQDLDSLDPEVMASVIKLDDTLLDASPPDLESWVTQFEESLSSALDKYAPAQTKMILERSKVPWFTKRVKEFKQKMRHREKLWRKYKRKDLWLAFKVARQDYHKSLNDAKMMVISNKVLECGPDMKKLYAVVNGLLGTTKCNPLPECDSDEELVESFASFFLDKIKKIHDNLDTHPLFLPDKRNIPGLTEFKPMSDEEILKVINEMPNKHCDLDPVPFTIFKKLAPHLKSEIAALVNISLSYGVFAESWKMSIVKPVLKKVGLELIFKNYRPVSNLKFLAKLVEKCMLLQFNEHCSMNSLLPSYQSAYRKFYSCETSLLKLTDNLLNEMENQRVSALVVMDLSAAFDTVDHKILLDVLSSQYGIEGKALKWFDTYLRPCFCQVDIKGARSSIHSLDFSVPQGSCAGPILYTVYASTLQYQISEGMDLNQFADDHSINKSFNPNDRDEELRTIELLESSLGNINSWMNLN